MVEQIIDLQVDQYRSQGRGDRQAVYINRGSHRVLACNEGRLLSHDLT